MLDAATALPAVPEGQSLLVTTDLMESDQHFRLDWPPPALLGRKLLAATLLRANNPAEALQVLAPVLKDKGRYIAAQPDGGPESRMLQRFQDKLKEDRMSHTLDSNGDTIIKLSDGWHKEPRFFYRG